MNKKNIALITLSLDGGGAEKVLLNIIKNLKDEINFTVITFYDKGVYLEELKSMNNISYQCIHADSGNTIHFALRIRKILTQLKPDCVVSFLYYPNIVTYLALINKKIPHLPSERSNHQKYLSKSFKHRVWKWLLKLTYNKARNIITVSEANKELIMKDFNVLPEKLINIYNGISFPTIDKLKSEYIDDFIFHDNTKYIIAVGNLSPVKNYPFLIESFSLLSSKYNNIKLLIIGKGEMLDSLKELVRAKKQTESIFFLGFKKNPHAYVARATCYVLSSLHEGFPNSLIEAMYVNGHVISTDCPTGPSEIITQMQDGILCPINDPHELASAIEKMCFDEDLRKKVYLSSREKIKQFDEQIMVTKYKELLAQ